MKKSELVRNLKSDLNLSESFYRAKKHLIEFEIKQTNINSHKFID